MYWEKTLAKINRMFPSKEKAHMQDTHVIPSVMYDSDVDNFVTISSPSQHRNNTILKKTNS